MENFVIDTEQFRSSYESVMQSEEAQWSKIVQREMLAEANNCIAIGRGSVCASMVAVPKDYPNIVIKITESDDAFIHFVRGILDGELKSRHFPEIYSMTEIKEGIYLIVMERLVGELHNEHLGYTSLRYVKANYNVILKESDDYPEDKVFLARAIRDLYDYLDNHEISACLDLHAGNAMMREDNTLVIIDPYF